MTPEMEALFPLVDPMRPLWCGVPPVMLKALVALQERQRAKDLAAFAVLLRKEIHDPHRSHSYGDIYYFDALAAMLEAAAQEEGEV